MTQSGLLMHWTLEALSDVFVFVRGRARGLEVIGRRWARSDARRKVEPALGIMVRVL